MPACYSLPPTLRACLLQPAPYTVCLPATTCPPHCAPACYSLPPCLLLPATALQADESFYTCKWSIDVDVGTPLLLLAGHTGVIRVIDCHTQKVVQVRPIGPGEARRTMTGWLAGARC